MDDPRRSTLGGKAMPGGQMSAASDPGSLRRLFGPREDLLPLWIAEPYVPLAAPVVAAIQGRASEHWFGRAGAGFARMTVAVAPEVIGEVTSQLRAATVRS